MRRCAYSVNRNPVARPMLPYHLRVLRPVCTKCQHIQVKRKTLLAEWAVSDSIDDLVQLRIGRHLLWAVWACMRILYACLMNDDERSAATHIACARNKKESTQNEEMEKCFYENMTMRWRRERESECVCSWSLGEKHLLGRRLFGSAHKFLDFFFVVFGKKRCNRLEMVRMCRCDVYDFDLAKPKYSQPDCVQSKNENEITTVTPSSVLDFLRRRLHLCRAGRWCKWTI